MDWLGEAEKAMHDILPAKSAAVYKKEEMAFKDYLKEHNYELGTQIPTREIFICYFKMLEGKYTGSLWPRFSYLNKWCQISFGTDLGDYCPALKALIKSNDANREIPVKKAKIFNVEDVERFLRDAPNEGKMLALKVVLILGFYGGLRKSEILSCKFENLSEEGGGFRVCFSPSKKKKKNAPMIPFLVLPKEDKSSCPVEILKLYISQVKERKGRILKNFHQKGRKYIQDMGENTVKEAPKTIAKFLNLPDYKEFSSHSFRRTSATVMADNGGSALQMKSKFGWSHESTIKEYFDHSKDGLKKAAQLLNNEEKIINNNFIDEREFEKKESPCVLTLNPDKSFKVKKRKEREPSSGEDESSDEDNPPRKKQKGNIYKFYF